MKKAIGYVRVSTSEQAEHGISLGAQEERIRRYCELQDLELVAVYRDEGVSASKRLRTRPEGSRVVDAEGDIVAVKLDRLFRNAQEALEESERWDRAGRGLHLVDMGGNSINTSSALGKFFFSTLAALAEMERNLTAERTREALAAKRRRGEKTGGGIPFGFEVEDGVLVEDAEEQATIAELLEMREAGWSWQRVADELNDRGITTKTGREWTWKTARKIGLRAA